MRMLAKITIPVEKGNQAIESGSLPQLIQSMIETFKPEGTYFSSDKGQRVAFIFFDLKNSSDMPTFAEPWFVKLNASVEFLPMMNLDDLKTGLGKLSANGMAKV